MSSATTVEPVPPPPPVEISQSGQTRISLHRMFGPTVQRHLEDTVAELAGNFDSFVQTELGMSPISPEADRLRWQLTGEGPGKMKQYSITLTGDQLPPELRQGTGGKLNVQMRIGGGNLQVRHDYFITVPEARAAQLQQRITPALERAVARAANPLIATAVSQALKQKAEQKLKPWLKQNQRLTTRVSHTLNYQTTGFVNTGYTA